ncbi:MAG: DNA cytosine methyltransferase [Candidatus Paceibacterota bacterium]
MKRKPQVIDFFCGAGGFSEGFRQQGFEVVMGIDNWLPAIETHNLNHNLNDKVRDVLEFGNSLEEINSLPDTEVIVGSPPCVLFSLSNKGGKADKTLGIRLIESYLRVIAIKKHQPSSQLKAWFMENVPNSRNYIRPTYTFSELDLTEWARNHGFDPNQIALNGSSNGIVLNTAEFGVSQKRERFVCGEIISTGKFPNLEKFMSKTYRSIGEVKGKMPAPNLPLSNKLFSDPNYPSTSFKMKDMTDHFYDSGIYEIQWRNAQYLKVNHPFMGKMSFPEDEKNPSRTIMATRSMTTRESLIYKSEYSRRGDGEYRLPTIREIATLMGFPYSYQFSGAENTKWRQVGNAVCPPMSSALAKSVRLSIGLSVIPVSKITFNSLKGKLDRIQNINTFSEKKFNDPPKRKLNARFRRHPFKDGNMTVALTNFNPVSPIDSPEVTEWYSSVFMGSGKDFTIKILTKSQFKEIAKFIEVNNKDLSTKFTQEFNEKFKAVIGNTHKFQEAYVLENSRLPHEPGRLVDEISDFIRAFDSTEKHMQIPDFLPGKNLLPIRQVLAMYALNRLVS